MKPRVSGFTLIEIMVALAVFAVVGAALIKNASLTVKQTVTLRDRTLAYWIAENEIGQMRSLPRDPKSFVKTGIRRHEVMMSDRSWEVGIVIANTENEDVRRVEVRVYKSDDLDNSVISLTTFMGRN